MRQRGVDATTERPNDLEVVVEPSTPATFAQVYAEAYLPMVRLGHLLTGSNEVGEEVTQEAFVRMYRRFDDVDNPGAYLRTAVLNGCRSWQRRQRLERRWAHREVPAPAAGGPTRGELADVLADLPFRQRAALVLRFTRTGRSTRSPPPSTAGPARPSPM